MVSKFIPIFARKKPINEYNMKKLFLSMILLALPFVVSAYDCKVDGIYYNLNLEEKKAEVTCRDFDYSHWYYYSDYYGDLIIPEKFTYEGVDYSVNSIGLSAFYHCNSLSSVSIPNSVTSIGDYAFCGCSSLTSATIPVSVTTIGICVFENCTSLTSVTIPNSVTTIGDEAFMGCSGLTSVTIPNSVTTIGGATFNGCSGLISVAIPNSVTTIGFLAFMGCIGLTSVHITDLEAWCNIVFESTPSNPLYYAQHLYLNGEEIKDLVIPNSVTNIGNSTFAGCSGLTSLTIPNSVTSIGNDAFSVCSGLSSLTIPNSVTSIGDYAFSDCSGLTSVTIPSSVTNIGELAFWDCNGLKSVTSQATIPPIANDYTFSNYSIPLFVPDEALNDYKTTIPWSLFETILPISSETKIENTTMQEAEVKDRFSLEGFKSRNSKKGLNIIRMSDGTVKKVVVK